MRVREEDIKNVSRRKQTIAFTCSFLDDI
jgi:hypothetical protein